MWDELCCAWGSGRLREAQGSLQALHSPIQHSRRAQGVVFTTSGGSTPTLRHKTKATLTVFICKEKEQHSLSAGTSTTPKTPASNLSHLLSHMDYFKQGPTDEIFHLFLLEQYLDSMLLFLLLFPEPILLYLSMEIDGSELLLLILN